MAPGAPLAWTPGERLVTSGGAEPSVEVASSHTPPAFRKLFFQGHLHFMAPTPALQRSRLLRAALIDCLRSLPPGGGGGGGGGGDAHADDLRAAITVWSFVEAVYLVDPSVDSAHVSVRLSDWYAQNFAALYDDARDTLNRDETLAEATDDAAFWATVVRLAAVGSRPLALRLVAARIKRTGFDDDWAEAAGAAALRVADDGMASGHSPLAVAEAMLAECPAESDSSFAARTDASWVRWQDTCDAWADDQGPEQNDKLNLLLKVLAGSVSHMARACRSWEEMLVATATYARRVLTDARHGHCVVEVENACAEASAVHDPPDHVAGGALVHAALGRPAEAIVSLGASLNTTWYAAHLCDLLMQAGQVQLDSASKWMPAPGNVSLLEYLTLEFVSKFERNRGLWRIAADYYNECPQRGQECLEQMLVRVPTDGPVDPVIDKILAFCDSNDVHDVAKAICVRVGTECTHARNYGGAVYWLARGGYLDRVAAVVESAISEAEESGPGSISAKALSHVVAAASVATEDDAVKERIDYARVYVDFQEEIEAVLCLHDGENGMFDGEEDERFPAMQRAERHALRLLCGGGLPRRFWIVVVLDVCLVLEKYQKCARTVSTDFLYELMSAVEVVCSSVQRSELLEGVENRLEATSARSNVADESANGYGLEGLLASPSVEASLQKMRTTLLAAVPESFLSSLA